MDHLGAASRCFKVRQLMPRYRQISLIFCTIYARYPVTTKTATTQQDTSKCTMLSSEFRQTIAMAIRGHSRTLNGSLDM